MPRIYQYLSFSKGDSLENLLFENRVWLNRIYIANNVRIYPMVETKSLSNAQLSLAFFDAMKYLVQRDGIKDLAYLYHYGFKNTDILTYMALEGLNKLIKQYDLDTSEVDAYLKKNGLDQEKLTCTLH